MLDGLYGWACYLLLGLFGCGLVARAQDRAADTRGLVVPVLAVAPYALIVFWLSGDTSLVAARPLTAMLVGVVYLLVLTFRTLRAAYGFIYPGRRLWRSCSSHGTLDARHFESRYSSVGY